MGTARYDEVAEWYDATLGTDPAFTAMPRATVLDLLGAPCGTLLDVGCGGGAHTAALAAEGWDVTGIDPSHAQRELARRRGCTVVEGRAEDLPFADASFDAVVSIWTHTDVEDWAAALGEVKRVAKPQAPFVYFGVHPCFVGPHSEFIEGKGLPVFHAGYYRTVGRYYEAPGIANPDGLRARVGAVHLPLAGFLQPFLDAGLTPERIVEPGTREFPIAIALRCRA
jgi:ubiquinone/menaquinone biosynthesis C-methylase UbiE